MTEYEPQGLHPSESTVLKPGRLEKVTRLREILESTPGGVTRATLIARVYQEEITTGLPINKVTGRFNGNLRTLMDHLRRENEGKTILSWYYTIEGKKGEFACYKIGYSNRF